MTDLDQLNKHPASQRAAKFLKAMKEPLDESMPHLVQLVIRWLELAEPNSMPGLPQYQQETRDQAMLLPDENPLWAASLLVPDYETLEREMDQAHNKVLQQEVLRNHLDGVLAELNEAKTPREAGAVLAENLYRSLHLALPSFGHLNDLQ